MNMYLCKYMVACKEEEQKTENGPLNIKLKTKKKDQLIEREWNKKNN